MSFFDFWRNTMSAVAGRKKEFDELLAAGDIQAVIDEMDTRDTQIIDAMREYDTMSHPVNFREDRIVTDKNGNFIRREPVWKLPVPYPVYINEIAVVFLYGRPIKWSQTSQDTDRAFAMFQDVIRRTRFDSKVRQCKRLAGAETESAMLFRVYKNEDGKPDVQIRVIARSKGDTLRTRFDQYGNLISIGWGYRIKEQRGEVVEHFDLFTPSIIYHCRRISSGWEVVEEENLIGKIPVILFQQDKEWGDTMSLMQRIELIASRTADTNDYFADPIAIMDADVVKNMPEKKDAAKLLIAKGIDGVEKAAKYLTWDSAPQSKKDEMEWLEDKILTMSFTPKISLDSLKAIAQLSAKALRTVMMLAEIKASRHKETHDEMMDRTASLITAIIGNVLDVSLKGECDKLQITHEFQEPFGDDIADALTNVVKAYDSGILSREGAVERNPLVADPKAELERLTGEDEARAAAQRDVFGTAE